MTDTERKQRRLEASHRYAVAHPERVRACRMAYHATHKKEAHEYYMANRDETIARSRAWKAEHPEKGSEYYAAHIAETRAHHASYYEQHKKVVDAKNAVWNKAHPALMKEVKAKSRKAHPETNWKVKAKRRDLGFVPLNQPFDGCNGHHIDRERVVYIPEVLHMSIRHNVWNGRNMGKINAVAFNFLFKQEVEAALVKTS